MIRLSAILLCLLPLVSRAAILTAPSAARTDVVNTLASAARGDTVRVPATSPNVTWSDAITISRGVHLTSVSGSGTTKILCPNGALILAPDATALSSGELFKVSELTFDGNLQALKFIAVVGATGGASKAFTNMAIGSCVFSNQSGTTSSSGAVSLTRQVRGVIYSNIFDRCNVVIKAMGNNDDGTEWANGNWPRVFGNKDNLFFEGNLIRYSSSYGGQDSGWTESGQGGRLVMRYNTWNMANGNHTELWDVHGFQNWPGNSQTGTMISEYYGNTVLNMVGGRWLTHRGGWGMFHNNICSGSGAARLEINQYAAGDTGGSGCMVDVAGAIGVYNGEVTNSYVFNNTVNGSARDMAPGPIGDGCGTAQNANWWNYTSGFNGTVGIGRGTSAPGGSPSLNVGYWVASTATPTTDPSVIQAGVFYKAVTAGSWTAYYTPYTFPHPLSGGAAVDPGDVVGPTVTITNPASAFTTNSLLFANLSGTASDALTNVATGLIWTNVGRGYGGGVNGTNSWSVVSNITLAYGANTISVSARDTSTNSNAGSAQVVITVTNVNTIYIWCLGDSLTQGNGVNETDYPGGYRLPLYQMLTNAGYDPIFVGSSTVNPSTQMPNNYHDGYGGYDIGDHNIAALGAALQHPPDIVLYEIGLNDYRHQTAVYTATNRLEQACSNIWTLFSSAKIVLAAENPWTDLAPTNNTMNALYTTHIPSIVARQVSYGKSVTLCDMRSPVLTDAQHLTADNTHKNALGYSVTAASWFSSMFATDEGDPDILPPTLLIVLPTASTITTGNLTTNLSGTAEDADTNVFQVAWTNVGRGYGGVATGTETWSVTGAQMDYGLNTFVVSARDASANSNTSLSQISITVTNPMTRYIWPLGDGFTAGWGIGQSDYPGGYRLKLYQLLTNAGYDPVFVGNTTNNPSSAMPHQYHDGYDGYTLTTLAAIADDLGGQLQAIPDYVLVGAGFEDFYQNSSVTTATNRVATLLTNVFNAFPSTKIIVAAMNPWTDLPATNTTLDTWYSPYLPDIVVREYGYGKNIMHNDMRRMVLNDSQHLTAGNIYFNQTGYDVMATNWFRNMFLSPVTNRVWTVGTLIIR